MSNTYYDENGTRYTDTDIDQWAREADSAYPYPRTQYEVDVYPYRAWEVSVEETKPRTIRLTDSMWHSIQKQAEKQHMSVAEWIRITATQALATAQ